MFRAPSFGGQFAFLVARHLYFLFFVIIVLLQLANKICSVLYKLQCSKLHIIDMIAHSITSSLISLVFFFFVYLWISEKSEVIFVHQNLSTNRLTYHVHAKSTGELIIFGFSDRSIRTYVVANQQESKRKKNGKCYYQWRALVRRPLIWNSITSGGAILV